MGLGSRPEVWLGGGGGGDVGTTAQEGFLAGTGSGGLDMQGGGSVMSGGFQWLLRLLPPGIVDPRLLMGVHVLLDDGEGVGCEGAQHENSRGVAPAEKVRLAVLFRP
jgi:hypothetical protein